ncbi:MULTISPECIES: MotA/TolQ/ExbB proton channel family protein [Bartonella]|uniref:Uncharacterized protein n=1 Tax=Bartonella choladocola TaxID=2750995 RepID=A0A1U9MJF9_9HYPH|nr:MULTISPECIES: MotA/TolQ/ExbB proton channel family protein [Bartonella]AQT48055.1 hypothetical protein BBC0122_019620 [Bartonella choladocola]MBH9975928.1 MotA/TolQ/ExbB proton channel family protein [Bartonella choladocola]MBI0015730.1 MotA/TolQ/ExbB proton channel family protein [Bartonella sp. B10834G3]MBI0141354.1 MotA/TolQ/ExbB proton channel family protein [Bartonella choladocola]
MRSTRSVLYFSLLLAMLSLIALLYTLIFHGDFVAHNIIFNSIIACFDVIVLSYALYTIFYLQRGMVQWQKFKQNFPHEGDEPVLKGGMRLLRGRLRDLISFNEDERNSAISLVSTALDWRVDFLFYAAGAVISMGLLGTFFGLTFTMEGIRGSIDVLSSADEIQAKSLVNSLAAPLGGMATAFSSSMFGLGSSICVGLIAHFMGRTTEGWVYDIEKWSFVASGEEASKMAGETGTIDATTRAINRLAAVLSRHVEFSHEDTGKFIDISNSFVQGQAIQQQTMEKMLTVVTEQSESNKRSVETILNTVTSNAEATKQIIEIIGNNYQALSELSDIAKTNSAYIARGIESQENNNQTVAQAIAGLNQIRIEFLTSLEAISNKLQEIQRDTGSIEQSAANLLTHSVQQEKALENANQVMHTQQKAIMEGMRDLTEARVSIVSAIKAAQKVSDVPPTKG